MRLQVRLTFLSDVRVRLTLWSDVPPIVEASVQGDLWSDVSPS